MLLQVKCPCRLIHLSTTKQIGVPTSSIYEPDYLHIGKSDVSSYEKLNIQLKGYDFPILEQYQKLVHTISDNLDIEVEDGWAVPPRHLTVVKYKPQGTVVDSEYKLKLYERNVQIVNVPSTTLSVLLEALYASIPQGVTLQIHEHKEEYEELRYVPDYDLMELKSQLETMSIPKKK